MFTPERLPQLFASLDIPGTLATLRGYGFTANEPIGTGIEESRFAQRKNRGAARRIEPAVGRRRGPGGKAARPRTSKDEPGGHREDSGGAKGPVGKDQRQSFRRESGPQAAAQGQRSGARPALGDSPRAVEESASCRPDDAVAQCESSRKNLRAPRGPGMLTW